MEGRFGIGNLDLLFFNGFLQSEVSLQDFQDAEPDILLHSTAEILERFNEKGIKCNIALKALCKKRGLHVEVILFHYFLSLCLQQIFFLLIFIDNTTTYSPANGLIIYHFYTQ